MNDREGREGWWVLPKPSKPAQCEGDKRSAVCELPEGGGGARGPVDTVGAQGQGRRVPEGAAVDRRGVSG